MVSQPPTALIHNAGNTIPLGRGCMAFAMLEISQLARAQGCPVARGVAVRDSERDVTDKRRRGLDHLPGRRIRAAASPAPPLKPKQFDPNQRLLECARFAR